VHRGVALEIRLFKQRSPPLRPSISSLHPPPARVSGSPRIPLRFRVFLNTMNANVPLLKRLRRIRVIAVDSTLCRESSKEVKRVGKQLDFSEWARATAGTPRPA